MRLQKLVREQRAEKIVMEKKAVDAAAEVTKAREQLRQAKQAQKDIQANMRTVQERLAHAISAKAASDERLQDKVQECERLANAAADAQQAAERSKRRFEELAERQRKQDREREEGEGEDAKALASLRQQLHRRSAELEAAIKERNATTERLKQVEKASSASLLKMSEEFQKQVGDRLCRSEVVAAILTFRNRYCVPFFHQEAKLSGHHAEVAALTKRAQQVT